MFIIIEPITDANNQQSTKYCMYLESNDFGYNNLQSDIVTVTLHNGEGKLLCTTTHIYDFNTTPEINQALGEAELIEVSKQISLTYGGE